MKKLLLSMIFLAAFFVFIPQSFAIRALNVVTDLDHKKGKIGTYRALVIGIQNYNDPKIPDLQTPLNDAKSIADVLQNKYGFNVETLLDGSATRKGLYDALRALSSKTKEEDSVLIYYAGHGDFDRQYDDGWWIPVDAKGGDPVTYLDNGQIQKAMRSMKARHVLLISDSCYSGTLFGQARAMPSVINDKYYLNLYNEKSRWGMTSGNKTPVSDSGTGGNSVFAYQLIKKLKINEKPYISTQEIYTDIAPVIANNSEQQPLCRPVKGTGDQGGEFIFVSTITTDQYPSNKISMPQVTAPEDRKISFDDIVKAGEKETEIKNQWALWQSDREKEYSQVQQIEKKSNLNNSLKKEAWLRFSSGVLQDNPFSTQDDEMRKYATQRISYWGKPPTDKKESDKKKAKFELKRKRKAQPKSQEEESIKIASINLNEKQSITVSEKERYIKDKNGIVLDKNTGLEWYAGPDKNMNLQKAKKWADNLDLDNGGWHLPSLKELNTIYKKGEGKSNCTPLLIDSEPWIVYSSDNRGYVKYPYIFHFSKGRATYDGSYKFHKVIVVRTNENESDKQKAKFDKRYVKYNNSIVYDKKTNLMWASEDNGKSVIWKEAKKYCDNFQGGGYKDWRMPTKDELAQLYDTRKTYKPAQYKRLDVHITELIRLSTPWVWVSDGTTNWRANYFGFDVGSITFGYRSETFAKRALPVRNAK